MINYIKKYYFFLEKKGTPDIVDDTISNIDIRNYIKTGLKININDVKLKADIIILFKSGTNYYGNVNYKEILDSNFEKCSIDINYPNEYNISNIIKTLTHELTHIYELYQIKDIFHKTKWGWTESLIKTKKQDEISNNIRYFRDILYLSLPHEINARVSSLFRYLYMECKDGYSKEQIIDVLKKTNEWQNYLNINDFSVIELINGLKITFKDDYDFLFFIFNELNSNSGINFKINNINDLNIYLDRFNKMVKKQNKKYYKKMIKVVDRIYNELNTDIEYRTYEILGSVNLDEYIKEDLRNERITYLEEMIYFNKYFKS